MPRKKKASSKSQSKPASTQGAAEQPVPPASAPEGAEQQTPQASAPQATIDQTLVHPGLLNVIGGGGTLINPIRINPIFFNQNPAISSLSPSGAVVGGGDFTLTVLGSNFGSTSTVTWNGAARPTTLVSNTQLTAAITASDLASPLSANVVVSNQASPSTAPVLSNGVAFVITPDISAIINQLQAVPGIPPTLITDLQTYITIQQSQIQTLNTQVSTDQTNIAALNSQIGTLQSTVTSQQAQITALTAQVQAASATSASPLDVAQSFKNVVDMIQQNAQTAGGLQTTVSNMKVQLKSLVSVQPSTATTAPTATLTFPAPTSLPDPAHLSTMSFSFRGIPSLTASAASAAPTPAPSSSPAAAPPAPPASSAQVSHPVETAAEPQPAAATPGGGSTAKPGAIWSPASS